MDSRGADVERKPPRQVSTRTFWIYVGFGPLIGSTLGLLAYMAPLFRGQISVSIRTLDVLGFIIVVAYLVGLFVGGPPAVVTGAVAASLHREGEPAWRSTVLGGLLGGLTCSPWLLISIAARLPPNEKALWLAGLGAVAGAACGLIQRTRPRGVAKAEFAADG